MSMLQRFMDRTFNSYFDVIDIKPKHTHAHHGDVSRPRNGDAADSPYIWRDNGLDTPGWTPKETQVLPNEN